MRSENTPSRNRDLVEQIAAEELAHYHLWELGEDEAGPKGSQGRAARRRGFFADTVAHALLEECGSAMRSIVPHLSQGWRGKVQRAVLSHFLERHPTASPYMRVQIERTAASCAVAVQLALDGSASPFIDSELSAPSLSA